MKDKNLSALVRGLLDGDAACAPVLLDLLLEHGTPQHAATAFINAVGLGEELTDPYHSSRLPKFAPSQVRLLADSIKPFVLYDTVLVRSGRWRAFVEFQHRTGELKTEAEANFTQSMRLPSYCSMALRRVSVEGAEQVEGHLQLQINRYDVLTLPLSDLAKRGVFGFPVFAEFTDRDDIRAWFDFHADGPGGVKLKLHGLLRSPIA